MVKKVKISIKLFNVTMGKEILLATCMQKFGTIELVFRALALTPVHSFPTDRPGFCHRIQRSELPPEPL